MQAGNPNWVAPGHPLTASPEGGDILRSLPSLCFFPRSGTSTALSTLSGEQTDSPPTVRTSAGESLWGCPRPRWQQKGRGGGEGALTGHSPEAKPAEPAAHSGLVKRAESSPHYGGGKGSFLSAGITHGGPRDAAGTRRIPAVTLVPVTVTVTQLLLAEPITSGPTRSAGRVRIHPRPRGPVRTSRQVAWSGLATWAPCPTPSCLPAWAPHSHGRPLPGAVSPPSLQAPQGTATFFFTRRQKIARSCSRECAHTHSGPLDVCAARAWEARLPKRTRPALDPVRTGYLF